MVNRVVVVVLGVRPSELTDATTRESFVDELFSSSERYDDPYLVVGVHPSVD